MPLRDIAATVAERRLETLRAIARQIASDMQPPEPPRIEVNVPAANVPAPVIHIPMQPAPIVNVTNDVPQKQQPINIQLVIPPEAIKVTVNTPPPQVTVNVPEQPTPNVTVHPPEIKIEAPTIDVNVPKDERPDPPKKARIKHADGSYSTVELS